ncbi:hypothetical protein LZ30DRAFT_404966 [Colletotrichum cereale]|nr:hypothetical protein LZ30DRAFT_404966 [Colletotrichum cereale]
MRLNRASMFPRLACFLVHQWLDGTHAVLSITAPIHAVVDTLFALATHGGGRSCGIRGLGGRNLDGEFALPLLTPDVQSMPNPVGLAELPTWPLEIAHVLSGPCLMQLLVRPVIKRRMPSVGQPEVPCVMTASPFRWRLARRLVRRYASDAAPIMSSKSLVGPSGRQSVLRRSDRS